MGRCDRNMERMRAEKWSVRPRISGPSIWTNSENRPALRRTPSKLWEHDPFTLSRCARIMERMRGDKWSVKPHISCPSIWTDSENQPTLRHTPSKLREQDPFTVSRCDRILRRVRGEQCSVRPHITGSSTWTNSENQSTLRHTPS